MKLKIKIVQFFIFRSARLQKFFGIKTRPLKKNEIIEDEIEFIVFPVHPFLNIPKDKNYPFDAVQCNHCGSRGEDCSTCENKGWLPNGHMYARHCEREACLRSIQPNNQAIYCSDECAFMDA